MLLDDRLVLSCAHVVADQLGDGTSARQENIPEGTVSVEFPFSESPFARRAAVVRWVPLGHGGGGDIAVLRLEQPAPPDAVPVPLRRPPTVRDHLFVTHGFPMGQYGVQSVDGRLAEFGGPHGEWIKTEALRDYGLTLQRGCSGAPVFDRTVNAVVGMVTQAYPAHKDGSDTRRTAFIQSIEGISRHWRGIRTFVRWRLDLDDRYEAHWRPAALGSGLPADNTSFFTGRQRILEDLARWIREPAQAQPLALLTGPPGCGKSAVLGHVLLRAEPTVRSHPDAEAPHFPPRCVDVAVHARGRSLGGVVSALAGALDVTAAGSDELIRALAGSDRHRLLVVDALDEAVSPEDAAQIATLLRRLTTGVPGIRCIVGLRSAERGDAHARTRGRLGREPFTLDLADPAYLSTQDLRDYAERRLKVRSDGTPSRYATEDVETVRSVAARLADRYENNFLFVQRVALHWADSPAAEPIVRGPVPPEQLPQTMDDVFELDLGRYGAAEPTATRLLTTLAFAEGDGLPADDLWCALADAIHPRTRHTPSDVDLVLRGSAGMLVSSGTSLDSGPVQLYHEAFAGYLRRSHGRQVLAREETHRRIAETLRSRVPSDHLGAEWAKAAPYSLRHLAAHAARGEVLLDLCDDPEFVVNSESEALARALPLTAAATARPMVAVFRAALNRLGSVEDITSRREILAANAARFGHRDLASAIVTAQGRTRPAWRPIWATSAQVTGALRAEFHSPDSGHYEAVTTTEVAGTHIVVAGRNDGLVETWDLRTREEWLVTPLAPPLPPAAPGDFDASMRRCVSAVLTVECKDRPAVLAGYCRGAVHGWYLDSGEPLDVGPVKHRNGVKALLAVPGTDGLVLSIDDGGHARIWRTGAAEESAVYQVAGDVTAAAVTRSRDGRLVLVTAHGGPLKVWDLWSGAPVPPQPDGTDYVPWNITNQHMMQLAATEVRGKPVVVSVSEDQHVRIWDLTSGRPRHQFPDAHQRFARSVAVSSQRPVAYTADTTGNILGWDLQQARPIARIRSAHSEQIRDLALVSTQQGELLVSAAAGDSAIRVWDTQDLEETPAAEGHIGKINAVASGRVGGKPVVASAGQDGITRLWDAGDGTFHRRFEGEPAVDEYAVDLATAKHGRPLLLAGGMDHRLKAWDLRNGDLLPRRLDEDAMDICQITTVRVGRRLFTVLVRWGGEIQLWDPCLPGPTAVLHPGGGTASDPLPQLTSGLLGRRPVAAGWVPRADESGCTTVWDLANGHERWSRPEPTPPFCLALALAELDDGPTVVECYVDRLVLWNLRSGKLSTMPLKLPYLHRWFLHNDSPMHCAMLSSSMLALGHEHTAHIYLINLTEHRAEERIAAPGPVRALTTLDDHTLIMATGPDLIAYHRSTAD
ncbi:trypsin-like peptidase domain-containing protein [Streptomyces sp. NPDC006999]|uniref:trypsin-like peptidase domain-containing protein n=1 Tax=Streptomyces sp. NPDC006999 TaxID=3156909 RepID=UPI003407EB3A